MSKLEEDFLWMLKAEGLPRPDEREFKFHPDRRWRVDFVYPSIMLAVEIEGGEWINGRHNRALAKDAEKYNELTLAGYKLLRFTGSMLKNGLAMSQLKRMLL
jgi:very-short-patch-repair endonuclease